MKTKQELRDECDVVFYIYDKIRKEDPPASFERYEAARKEFETALEAYRKGRQDERK